MPSSPRILHEDWLDHPKDGDFVKSYGILTNDELCFYESPTKREKILARIEVTDILEAIRSDLKSSKFESKPVYTQYNTKSLKKKIHQSICIWRKNRTINYLLCSDPNASQQWVPALRRAIQSHEAQKALAKFEFRLKSIKKGNNEYKTKESLSLMEDNNNNNNNNNALKYRTSPRVTQQIPFPIAAVVLHRFCNEMYRKALYYMHYERGTISEKYNRKLKYKFSNVAICPIGLWQMLGLFWLGANGRTKASLDSLITKLPKFHHLGLFLFVHLYEHFFFFIILKKFVYVRKAGNKEINQKIKIKKRTDMGHWETESREKVKQLFLWQQGINRQFKEKERVPSSEDLVIPPPSHLQTNDSGVFAAIQEDEEEEPKNGNAIKTLQIQLSDPTPNVNTSQLPTVIDKVTPLATNDKEPVKKFLIDAPALTIDTADSFGHVSGHSLVIPSPIADDVQEQEQEQEQSQEQSQEPEQSPDDFEISDISSSKRSRKASNAPVMTQLYVGTCVWVDSCFSISPSFSKTFKRYLRHAALSDESKHKRIQRKINEWAGRQTNSKIEHVMEEINYDAASIGVSTLYFKGVFEYEFDVDDTFQLPFFTSEHCDCELKQIPFMHDVRNVLYYNDIATAEEANRVGKCCVVLNYHLLHDDLLQSLSLVLIKYTSCDFSQAPLTLVSFHFILGLVLLYHNWLGEVYDLINNCKEVCVDLRIPKMDIVTHMDVAQFLEESQHLNVAFDSTEADFSKMCNNAKERGLHMSQLIQQIHLCVDETGFTPAYTKHINEETKLPETPVEIIKNGVVKESFNYPFDLYLLTTQNDLVWFVGRIADPSPQTKFSEKASTVASNSIGCELNFLLLYLFASCFTKLLISSFDCINFICLCFFGCFCWHVFCFFSCKFQQFNFSKTRLLGQNKAKRFSA
ncbi:hypothetical protein RFI_24689 [Reticulomyxa filosa]|uniref:PH domain-containing protein n=1 Tax=Reticulomyxa filosa TaxID=46433 RepID=X6MG80_RETFI|nr:hypothetical protein RFI_24689 [Reticulomyxa filosa]|eukprot:ETO12686.1 hypothetical protein RFI_24689 [Reticulomyxa filosa]